MKRFREIILDFTPLLDVTLIILFYFIMFSHIGAVEAQEKANQAVQEAQAAQTKADEATQQARKKEQEAEDKKKAVEDADAHSAEVADALIDYSSKSLHLDLHGEGTNQVLIIKQGNNELDHLEYSVLMSDELLGSALLDNLEKAGYTEENVILCNLIYDSNNNGTKKLYKKIDTAFENLKKQFGCLYISINDIYIDDDST